MIKFLRLYPFENIQIGYLNFRPIWYYKKYWLYPGYKEDIKSLRFFSKMSYAYRKEDENLGGFLVPPNYLERLRAHAPRS